MSVRELPYLVGLTKPQMSFVLDCLDHYARTKAQPEILGDIRERLVLARYGKIRKTKLPAIRAGKRTP